MPNIRIKQVTKFLALFVRIFMYSFKDFGSSSLKVDLTSAVSRTHVQ